jgi:acetyl esterase/lipase
MSEYQAAAHMPAPPESLSAQARAWIAQMVPLDMEGPIDLAMVRPMIEALQTIVSDEQRKTHAVTVTDDVVASVPVRRIARSDGAVNTTSLLINVHGGGFAIDAGSLTENVPIAALTGIEVLAVRYRLAPEHPFPAAVDDALAVYKAMLAEHEARDIGVYGTSAGAVIGPQLMMRLRAEGLPTPGALGVFSGEADLSGTADSLRIFASPVEGNALIDAKLNYVGAADPRDPLVSPIFGDLSGFPPTLLISSGRDILLSGTINLARALTDAGVAAELVVYDALPHAFWAQMISPESDDAFRRMAAFLSRHTGKR